MEHLQAYSTHRHGALTDVEHSQTWSTYRHIALTDMEHSQVRNIRSHRVWSAQTTFVGLFHMLCSKIHLSPIPRGSSTPLHGHEPSNPVLFLWLLKSEDTMWFIHRKETFQSA